MLETGTEFVIEIVIVFFQIEQCSLRKILTEIDKNES